MPYGAVFAKQVGRIISERFTDRQALKDVADYRWVGMKLTCVVFNIFFGRIT
jgi:hypothetical protein